MANENYIVVFDPSGDYWEGSLVDAKRARQLEARNVVLLPVIPDLFRRAGVGGYHRRAWGAGWSLNHSIPKMCAPLTMYCSKDFDVVHWAARLIPEPEFLEKLENDEAPFTGALRIASDAGQSNPYRAGVTAIDFVDPRALTAKQLVDGGFNVGGSAKVTIPGDSFYPFAIHGFAPGLRVVWAAISQAAE